MSSNFSKLYIALKFRLHGIGFFKALVALEKGRDIHKGFRKDDTTPEYQHQLEIALFVLTLKDVQDLEGAIICALLHDTIEDYPNAVSEKWISDNFGEGILNSLKQIDKNSSKNYEVYISALAEDMNGSIVKLCDRINNFQSMNRGNFTIEKQKKYANEVKVYFLVMAKRARKLFPRQMDAYYNVETMLKNQYELIQLFIKASENTAPVLLVVGQTDHPNA